MSTENTKPEPPKQRPLSPREEAIAAITGTRNADFEKETGIHIEESVAVIDPDIDPEAAAAEAERARLQAASNNTPEDEEQRRLQAEQEEHAREQREAAARQAADATARAASGIDPAAKYTLKVNGREVELSGEEVLRRAQKDTAADQRLEEANRIMREAQALQQSLQEQQRAQAEADQARSKGGNADGVIVDPSVTKEFTSALFKGDEETAAAAFNKAVTSAVAAARESNAGRGQQAAIPVDPSAIAAQVRQQIAIDSALEQSRNDYPEMYADPDIEAVAAAKLERKVKEGTPFVAALSEVSGELATKFGWKKRASSGTPKVADDNRRGEKLARKESLEPPPGGLSVKTATQEEPTMDVSAAIREIAKSRGQMTVS